MGEVLKVRVYENRIEAYYGSELQLGCERRRNRQARIDYRHVIWSLVRKPGAFARYVYREELFPSLLFRRADDAIQTPHHGTAGDLEDPRLFPLAARTLQAHLGTALALLFETGAPLTAHARHALGEKAE